jgi:dienelactone hydrolase
MGKRRLPLIAAAAGLALLAAVVLVVVLRSSGETAAPRVRIEPADALLDAPLRREVDGAQRDAAVELRLSATSADGVLWSGSRTVQADDDGRVSVDGGALLASLRPDGVPDSPTLGLFPRDGTVKLRLQVGQREEALGTALGTRRLAGPGVSARQLTVARDGLAARYWTGPVRNRRATAVLAVGGSEGGFANAMQAALLASHGYPVLQLAYFRAPGLPRKLRSIPLEYVERALEWLHARPGVTAVVMVGASRGAELAVLVGSTYPALVQGVAAFAPGYEVVPDSWTRGGVPVPSPADPDPRIPVERIRGPVLLVAGAADQVWDSAYSAAAIDERRHARGALPTEDLTFDDAGHGVTVAVPYLPFPTEFSLDGFTLVSGGTRQADVLARNAAWPRLLALLRHVDR